VLKTRLIPVLLLQNGFLVRSEGFRIHQILGLPLNEVERFNEWNVDELIYLDITRDDTYDVRRDDHKVKGRSDPLEILDAVARTCFMPLTWGGRIRSVPDMHARISRGADKITLNSAALTSPELISAGAKTFGSQAIVVSIDVFRHPDGKAEVVIDGGTTFTGLSPETWAREAESRGAGEILLQSVQCDGAAGGYDLELIESVATVTTIPVIACSGVGRYEHYVSGVRAGASAVAAANIWHFKELSDRAGKKALAKAGIDVRL
jgi:imidazole glycerol-phosphate synthase subunit HisF